MYTLSICRHIMSKKQKYIDICSLRVDLIDIYFLHVERIREYKHDMATENTF